MWCVVAGVQDSHGQSLADLLSQHALVKVQLNAATADSESVGDLLGTAAGVCPRFWAYPVYVDCLGM